jgi:NitT/TauT family transport system permease protein
MRISTEKNRLLTLAAVLALIAGWKVVSLLVGSPIILPSPEDTFTQFFLLLAARDFWPALGATLVRGAIGFVLSCCAGVIVGILAGLKPGFRLFVSPFISIVKTVPVMSIILLALIWFHSDAVPVFVSFLMTFPIICGNVIEGVGQSENLLVEMASLFRVSRRTTLLHVYIPSIFPYFIAGASTALGITWKVVIAAEVLAQPVRALGSGLQEARIQLNTAEVFAWTAAAILVSTASEKLLELSVRKAPWRRR